MKEDHHKLWSAFSNGADYYGLTKCEGWFSSCATVLEGGSSWIIWELCGLQGLRLLLQVNCSIFNVWLTAPVVANTSTRGTSLDCPPHRQDRLKCKGVDVLRTERIRGYPTFLPFWGRKGRSTESCSVLSPKGSPEGWSPVAHSGTLLSETLYRFPSPFPHQSSLGKPENVFGLTSQINYWSWSPCFRVCFWGTQTKIGINLLDESVPWERLP